MRSRAVGGRLAASPTMVGAVTVMVIILAVFLAYNANTGLPFVPTYRLSVLVPNAESLVEGNEVRIGGVRVGLVEQIEPVQQEDGSAVAQLDLKLDSDVDPLPVDSTLIVRARSALGLKYLEINKGSSSEGYEQGSVLPLNKATPEPVEIDQVLNTFDEPTRVSIRENLVEFGDALAGRGPDLNAALGRLPGVLEHLEPVMRNIGAPATGLERFITASADAAAEVAPVAEIQGQLFVSLDTTFTALAGVAPSIEETIVETPPTFDTATRALPVIRPFLDHSATLFTEFQPGVRAISRYAPTIADSLELGTPVLRDAPILNRELPPTAAALARFNDNAAVRDGLDRLIQTTDILGPAIRFIAPAQTVCNYGTLLARNVASLFSQGADGGKWQRFTVFDPPEGPNNEGSQAAAPASGGGEITNFLHANPYPNTASPGQKPIECEAGNEPYLTGRQVIGNVPGDQGTSTDAQRGAEAPSDEEAAE
ncbi:MAG: Mammalian cell entry related domain protein [Solirubrobacterales bacterium]|nr:Mammalian cell entry related domain protein [Solirubrobacterales bacterium]